MPRQAGSDRSHAFPGPQRAVVAVNGAVATDRGGGKMGRDDDRESSSVLRYEEVEIVGAEISGDGAGTRLGRGEVAAVGRIER